MPIDSQIPQKTYQVKSGGGLPSEWAAFLDKPEWSWAWYGHYTFRDIPDQFSGLKRHVHPESAVKAWDKFIHILNREIFGSRYWKRKHQGVVWARGTELQNRGAIHFHALIGGVPSSVRRLEYKETWNDLAGFARIYEYEQGRGAEAYLSKSAYAWKRGDIDLGGPLALKLSQAKEQGLFGSC